MVASAALRTGDSDIAVVDAGTYEVRIRPGLLSAAGAMVAAVAPAHRYVLVSDSNVAPLYAAGLSDQLNSAGGPVVAVTIAAGESQKTVATWAAITDQLLASRLGRDTTIVALGGGVVCDVAGFVAATFLRGVPVVHVPTTLLAMIDASIGGKTGVDTAHGKNLVGAFHQPAAVLVDPEVLDTLPEPELRSGLAEALKHGAIADAEYFDFVAATAPRLLAPNQRKRDVLALNHVIEKSVRLKVGVVAADERERGARKALNFGHTIGHAIELLSGFTMRHGEAVGVGMLLETTAAERAGVTEIGTAARIHESLLGAGLPVVRPTGPSARDLLDLMLGDKKSRSGSVEYAVPARIGMMAAAEHGYTVHLPDSLVAEVLA